jgi:hypothetical protein
MGHSEHLSCWQYSIPIAHQFLSAGIFYFVARAAGFCKKITQKSGTA